MARADTAPTAFVSVCLRFQNVKRVKARADDGLIDVSPPPSTPPPPPPPCSSFTQTSSRSGWSAGPARWSSAPTFTSQLRTATSVGEPMMEVVGAAWQSFRDNFGFRPVRSPDKEPVGTVLERGGDDPSECQSQKNLLGTPHPPFPPIAAE